MPPLLVDLVADIGQPVTAYSGVPSLFLDLLNQYWQANRMGKILLVRPPPPTHAGWVDVGNVVLYELLQRGGSIGVYLEADGTWPVGTVAQWLIEAGEAEALSRIDLSCSTYPHPMSRERYLAGIVTLTGWRGGTTIS